MPGGAAPAAAGGAGAAPQQALLGGQQRAGRACRQPGAASQGCWGCVSLCGRAAAIADLRRERGQPTQGKGFCCPACRDCWGLHSPLWHVKQGWFQAVGSEIALFRACLEQKISNASTASNSSHCQLALHAGARNHYAPTIPSPFHSLTQLPQGCVMLNNVCCTNTIG